MFVLEEAASDIEQGIDFYEAIESGIGLYFRDSIIADIRKLGFHPGTHRVHLGFFRTLSSRFPYAIYYRDDGTTRQIVAVLDLRRSPGWTAEQLSGRQDKTAG